VKEVHVRVQDHLFRFRGSFEIISIIYKTFLKRNALIFIWKQKRNEGNLYIASKFFESIFLVSCGPHFLFSGLFFIW